MIKNVVFYHGACFFTGSMVLYINAKHRDNNNKITNKILCNADYMLISHEYHFAEMADFEQKLC